MNYYILKHASATKETGPEFPQIQTMDPNYQYDAPDSVHSLRVSEFPNIKPNLDHFVLHNKAKATDLVSEFITSGGGLLVSETLKRIFEMFKLVPHIYYPAKLFQKDTFYTNYYLMHIVSDLTDFIDYTRSKFFIYKNYSSNIGYINIKSKDDFFKKRQKLKEDNPNATVAISAEKIKLSTNFDHTLDLFIISTFDANIYISEHLASKINLEGITGIQLTATNRLY